MIAVKKTNVFILLFLIVCNYGTQRLPGYSAGTVLQSATAGGTLTGATDRSQSESDFRQYINPVGQTESSGHFPVRANRLAVVNRSTARKVCFHMKTPTC